MKFRVALMVVVMFLMMMTMDVEAKARRGGSRYSSRSSSRSSYRSYKPSRYSSRRYTRGYYNSKASCNGNLNETECKHKKLMNSWTYQEKQCCAKWFNVHAEVDEPTNDEVDMLEEILTADSNMSYLDQNDPKEFVN